MPYESPEFLQGQYQKGIKCLYQTIIQSVIHTKTEREIRQQKFEKGHRQRIKQY